MSVRSIAVIGLGKIAKDQHLPVIAGNPDFELAATVSQRGLSEPGVVSFRTPEELFASRPDIQCVAICTPPGARYAIARAAIEAGKHVLLESHPSRRRWSSLNWHVSQPPKAG